MSHHEPETKETAEKREQLITEALTAMRAAGADNVLIAYIERGMEVMVSAAASLSELIAIASTVLDKVEEEMKTDCSCKTKVKLAAMLLHSILGDHFGMGLTTSDFTPPSSERLH